MRRNNFDKAKAQLSQAHAVKQVCRVQNKSILRQNPSASTATLIVCVAAIGCFPNFFADLIKFTFSPEIFQVIGMN